MDALQLAKQCAITNLRGCQAQLLFALELASEAQAARRESIVRARELGLSKTEIAKALGVSRQAVSHVD